jgi:hypothetical protein
MKHKRGTTSFRFFSLRLRYTCLKVYVVNCLRFLYVEIKCLRNGNGFLDLCVQIYGFLALFILLHVPCPTIDSVPIQTLPLGFHIS